MPTRFPILIVDASSYFLKIYYSPKTKLSYKTVNFFPVYSFCRMLRKLATQFNFAHIVVVWDGYKEVRPSIGLLAQKKLAMEFIDLIRMEQILQINISAYDVIFSMVTSFNHQHHDVIIVSNNHNLFSLVNDATTIFDPFTNITYNRELLEKKYKFPLEKFPLFLALAGTTTGHISGVYGIGKKRAMLYAQKFKDLDDLYKNINQISGTKTQAALIEGKQNAYESFKLAAPHHHLNPTTVARTTFPEQNWQLAIPFFKKYHYQKLLNEIQVSSLPSQQAVIDIIQKTDQAYFDLITMTTKEQVTALIDLIKKTKTVSIKIQGSSDDPMQSMLLNIALATDYNSVYYIQFYNEDHKDFISQEEFLLILKTIFLDSSIEKIINNAQYTLVMLLQLGLPIYGSIFDTTHAASLLLHNLEDEELKKIDAFYRQQANLSYQHHAQQQEIKNGSPIIKQESWYNIADVHQSFILKKFLESQLHTENVATYFKTIEMPIAIILAEMQATGIYCNKKILEQLSVKLADDTLKITEAIHNYSPASINLNSNQQVRKLLFEILNLPIRKKLRQKTPSTDAATLQELLPLHPLPGLILKYRELHKYQHTYLENLRESINIKTGKIHPMWEQALGKTGRITAKHPNIQSIPVRDSEYGIHIRSAFYPQKNDVFMSANYNDIELHIIAYLSQDIMLKMALAHTTDIHTKTASKLFSTPEHEVTPKQRSIAKKINLSITYGITAYGLAKDQNIPYHQAAFAMRSFFSNFPSVRGWINTTIEKLKHNGYISTMFGRKRYIPTIRSKNRIAYDSAIRLALNTVIQGSAAEIVKIGVIHATEKLRAHKINAQIVIHIHDQIIVSVLQSDLQAAQKIITEAFTCNIASNLVVKLTILTGNNWQEVSLQA